MSAIVTIYDKNNIAHELPNASFYNGITATIVDSGRNAEGYTKGAVIRDDVGKVELKWRYLTTQQWSGILKLFKTASGGSFSNKVKFFDQTEGAFQTREMYVSDRSAGAWEKNSNDEVIGWTDCALSLVEV